MAGFDGDGCLTPLERFEWIGYYISFNQDSPRLKLQHISFSKFQHSSRMLLEILTRFIRQLVLNFTFDLQCL